MRAATASQLPNSLSNLRAGFEPHPPPSIGPDSPPPQWMFRYVLAVTLSFFLSFNGRKSTQKCQQGGRSFNIR